MEYWEFGFHGWVWRLIILVLLNGTDIHFNKEMKFSNGWCRFCGQICRICGTLWICRLCGVPVSLQILFIFIFFLVPRKDWTCKIIFYLKILNLRFLVMRKPGYGNIGIYNESRNCRFWPQLLHCIYFIYFHFFWCQGRIEPVKLFFTWKFWTCGFLWWGSQVVVV